MLKKKVGIVLVIIVLLSLFSMQTFALAETKEARTATQEEINAKRSSSTPFFIQMELNGPSSYSTIPATKVDSRDALIMTHGNTVYWPMFGDVTLRVRNESRQYATVASVFESSDSQMLPYLSGQNYTGTKWLYGSGTDNMNAGFGVNGSWIP